MIAVNSTELRHAVFELDVVELRLQLRTAYNAELKSLAEEDEPHSQVIKPGEAHFPSLRLIEAMLRHFFKRSFGFEELPFSRLFA